MRAINLSDKEQRDSPVAFEPVSPISEVGFVLPDGKRVRGDTPKSALRSRSLRRCTAPGAAPIRGASDVASTVFPVPDSPPMAISCAGAASR